MMRALAILGLAAAGSDVSNLRPGVLPPPVHPRNVQDP